MTLHRRPAALLLGALCVLVIGAVYAREAWPLSTNLAQSDFHFFYDAATALRQHQDPYAPVLGYMQHFTPGTALQGFYVYTPVFAALLIPLTLLPAQAALGVWVVANLALLFVTVYALLRCAGIRPTPLAWLVLTCGVVVLDGVRADIASSQSDILVLALVSLGLWAGQGRRKTLGGVLLALACITKPMLLVLPIVLLWKREYKLGAAALASFVAFLILPCAWLGGKLLGEQLAVWRFWSNQYASYYYNYAPKALLIHLFEANPVTRPVVVWPGLATVASLLISAVLVVITAAYVAPRPLRRDARTMLELGLVLAAMFLISPLTEDTHLAFAVLPLISLYAYLVLDAPEAADRRRLATAALVIAALLSLPPHRSTNFFFYLAERHAHLAPLYIILAPDFLYLLIALFALQLVALRRSTGQGVAAAVRGFWRDLPRTLRAWMDEGTRALPGRTRRQPHPDPLAASGAPVEP